MKQSCISHTQEHENGYSFTRQLVTYLRMKNKIIILIQCLLASIIFIACTDKFWDEHYVADTSLVADKNLWESIEATPELSAFAALLKETGYDKILSQSQAYTVFAPNNNALAGFDKTGVDVKTELVENHIARFVITASGDGQDNIYMLNRKLISFSRQGSDYSFGSAVYSGKDLVASNGVVHILSGYEAYFPNIYELLAKRADLDSLHKYVYSFNRIEFYEEASVPGSVVDGQLTYLDSVFVNSNELLRRLGYINREDSSYTLLAPNNAAWIEGYERIKKDFVYYNASAGTADSLQQANTSFALVQDLFFNNNIQLSPADSLVSTSWHTFYNPQELLENLEPINTSNGSVYITDLLKIKPYQSWLQPITVEAERVLGRESTLSNLDARRVVSTDFAVSGGRYLQVMPSTASGNPTVTFEIPNTLSSTYNIYCVFVTPLAANPNAVGLKANKVFYRLNYIDGTGAAKISQYPESGAFETNPNVMDTMLVVQDFKFPVANYGEETATVKLQILSRVASNETATFSRELLLDCILLEPVKE
jgi:hypothetical protein